MFNRNIYGVLIMISTLTYPVVSLDARSMIKEEIKYTDPEVDIEKTKKQYWNIYECLEKKFRDFNDDGSAGLDKLSFSNVGWARAQQEKQYTYFKDAIAFFAKNSIPSYDKEIIDMYEVKLKKLLDVNKDTGVGIIANTVLDEIYKDLRREEL